MPSYWLSNINDNVTHETQLFISISSFHVTWESSPLQRLLIVTFSTNIYLKYEIFTVYFTTALEDYIEVTEL